MTCKTKQGKAGTNVKNGKKILSLLMALVMVLSLSPVSGFAMEETAQENLDAPVSEIVSDETTAEEIISDEAIAAEVVTVEAATVEPAAEEIAEDETVAEEAETAELDELTSDELLQADTAEAVEVQSLNNDAVVGVHVLSDEEPRVMTEIAGVEFEVKEMTAGLSETETAALAQAVADTYQMDFTKVWAVDIALSAGSLNGATELCLSWNKLSSLHSGTNGYVLFHIHDGAAEAVKYTVAETEDAITFTVDSLSPFVLVKLVEPAAEEPEDEELAVEEHAAAAAPAMAPMLAAETLP